MGVSFRVVSGWWRGWWRGAGPGPPRILSRRYRDPTTFGTMSIGAHVRAGGSSSPPSSGGRRSGPRWCRSSPRAPGPGSRPSTPTRSSTSTGWPRRTARSSPRPSATPPTSSTWPPTNRTCSQRSVDCLAANLAVATGMGASGLVLHVGSHKGSGFADCLPQVVDALGWRPRALRRPVDGRLPDPAGERGGHRRHGRAQLRGAGRHSRRRRCRARPPLGRLPRYAASVGLGDRLHLGGGGRRRRGRLRRRHRARPAALPAPQRLQGRARGEPGPARQRGRGDHRGAAPGPAAQPPGPGGPPGHARGPG